MSLFIVICFGTGSHKAQASYKFTMYPRVTLILLPWLPKSEAAGLLLCRSEQSLLREDEWVLIVFRLYTRTPGK